MSFICFSSAVDTRNVYIYSMYTKMLMLSNEFNEVCKLFLLSTS